MSLMQRARFATTEWTLILRASDPGASVAREELAKRYWFPLYAYARRRGHGPERSEDAVQTFLSRLLTSGALERLTVERGRFRDFLLTGLENEFRDEHRAETAAKRRPTGGFVRPGPWEPETRYVNEALDTDTPERLFDRLCALSFLDATAEKLREEFCEKGREALYEHLLLCVHRDPDRRTHEEAAARLGFAEATLRNKVFAFRRRFHDVFRSLVCETLTDPERVDDEIRALIAALGR